MLPPPIMLCPSSSNFELTTNPLLSSLKVLRRTVTIATESNKLIQNKYSMTYFFPEPFFF